MKCCFGFTPNPECDNCLGTGIFSENEKGEPEEPCAFCLEDAIVRGEIEGTVGDQEPPSRKEKKTTVKFLMLAEIEVSATEESVALQEAQERLDAFGSPWFRLRNTESIWRG
jgi:hypothetical protein